MNNNKSWNSIGEEIRSAVDKAIKEGDFSQISDVAVNAVNDAVKNVTDMVGHAVNQNPRQNYTARMEQVTRERKESQNAIRHQNEIKTAQKAPFQPVGRISSILYKVFGGIGTTIMGILTAVFLGLGLGLGDGWLILFFIFAILLGGFVGMTVTGCSQGKRLQRAKKYLELAGHNHYINVGDLALHTNRNRKFVIKDLKSMFLKGFFPQGHLDTKEECLMLDDRIYAEYLNLEKQKKVQEIEQKKSELSAPKTEEKEHLSELDEMILEGQSCIRRLRDMNDNIAGEEISAKLFRLENLLKEIFDCLKEHPEQMPQMKKFMNYYLPTTLKLVGAYEEFDTLSEQGPDIKEAKEEIEKTLDAINAGFAELLNKLFRETAYDVTTDARVLQTMLAKEGLTADKELEKVLR